MKSRSNNSGDPASGTLGGDSLKALGRASWRSAPPADERLVFLRGFFAHPAQVGSVIPSSRYLAQRLVKAADIGRARMVVELGPGTGGTTRALLHALPDNGRLLAIELSPHFHGWLAERLSDPRVMLRQGSAEQLGELLEALYLPAPDAILSGIPFSTMPADVARRISAGIAQCLAPGGRFVAYQARDCVARFMRSHLGMPTIDWEWRNVPPLRVFRWTKPRSMERV